jgi:copper chaperone CopZ
MRCGNDGGPGDSQTGYSGPFSLEKSLMKVMLFKVDKNICTECSMALRRFIGGMDGVESIDVQNGRIVVKFDETGMDEENLSKIARGSIERLGYRLDE